MQLFLRISMITLQKMQIVCEDTQKNATITKHCLPDAPKGEKGVKLRKHAYSNI